MRAEVKFWTLNLEVHTALNFKRLITVYAQYNRSEEQPSLNGKPVLIKTKSHIQDSPASGAHMFTAYRSR
jgi:hypothetical protein